MKRIALISNKTKLLFKEYCSPLTFKLAFYDFSKIYKGSALGIFWTFFKPVFSSLIFYLGNIAIRGSFEDLPSHFPSWMPIIIGMVIWQYISDGIGQTPSVILDYSFLVSKMQYKKSKIYFFANLSKFMQHLVLMIIFFLIYVIIILSRNDLNFSEKQLTLLQLPLVAIMMILFFFSWTFLIAPFCVISKDVKELISLFVMCAFWVSGTFFDPESLIKQSGSSNLQQFIYQLITLNPLATFVSLFKVSYFGGTNITLIDGTNAVDYNWFFQGHFYNGIFIGYWYKIIWVFIWIVLFIIVGSIISKKTKTWINDLL